MSDTKQATETATLRTKHIAALVAKALNLKEFKPVQLRRVLRSMPKYADGVHTNYKWAESNKAAITEIVNAVKALNDRKIEAAKAAQAALAKKQAEDKKQAETDKKVAA